MRFLQTWMGACVRDGELSPFFPASVPGNIQFDYAKYRQFGDVNYGDHAEKFRELEDCGWRYQTELVYEKAEGERVFFVSEGIEYEYDVCLNGKKLLHHTGMFSKVSVDITDELENGNLLTVSIAPHPKRAGADECREQADQSCKPAVGYGWDWHPRLLVSGIWNDTYLETRDRSYIDACDVTYTLSEDLASAKVCFHIDCKEETTIELLDADGTVVYRGADPCFELKNVRLWWCSEQGEPYLYRWRVCSRSDEKHGRLGFRRVRLVMNGGAWDEPSVCPKTRSIPPITVELNGRRIFAKGSNWVCPEIFTGTITKETYAPLLKLAKDAHMNILRSWGGSIVNKDSFFELCDELGLMVWQEFPLACNCYTGSEDYLLTLNQEATAIIKRLRSHPCIALWCGGNELFNSWSKMTDQSYALRLLNKLCYELDRETPFLPTAPVMGMAHGSYTFYDADTDRTVFEIFTQGRCSAYSEFGVPAITPMPILKEIIPPELLHDPKPKTAWELHHAFHAWGKDRWLCRGDVDEIFGKQPDLAAYIEKSSWMQTEGLTCIFEEARRQAPYCSMALSWCFNEPWITAAGQSLIAYPCRPKAGYEAVKKALRPTMPSARIEHFSYISGETLVAELWLLNDSPKAVTDSITVTLVMDGKEAEILTWNCGTVLPNTNCRGHKVQIPLPMVKQAKPITLCLKAACGSNSYRLLLKPKTTPEVDAHQLNV